MNANVGWVAINPVMYIPPCITFPDFTLLALQVGVGLRVLRRRRLPRHGLLRRDRAAVGPLQRGDDPDLQRTPQAGRVLRAQRQRHCRRSLA